MFVHRGLKVGEKYNYIKKIARHVQEAQYITKRHLLYDEKVIYSYNTLKLHRKSRKSFT